MTENNKSLVTNADASQVIAAVSGAGVAGLTMGIVNTIFQSIAPACKTVEQKIQYIMRCKSLGIAPTSGQLKAMEFQGRLMFHVGASEYMSWCQQAGWILVGEGVLSSDIWEGWDAVEMKPIKHVVPGGAKLGAPVGAWARAVNVKSGAVVGNFFEARELVNSRNSKYTEMPRHMVKIAAMSRVARTVIPAKVENVYSTEELQMQTLATAAAPAIPATPPARPKTVETTFSMAESAPVEPPANDDEATLDAHAEPLDDTKKKKPEPDEAPAPPKKSAQKVSESDICKQIKNLVAKLVSDADDESIHDAIIYYDVISEMQIGVDGALPVTHERANAMKTHVDAVAANALPDGEKPKPLAVYNSILTACRSLIQKNAKH